jgi:hypothetical protein
MTQQTYSYAPPRIGRMRYEGTKKRPAGFLKRRRQMMKQKAK